MEVRRYPARLCEFRLRIRGDWKIIWRGGRVVEGARLESVYTETYRGFESLLLRQIKKTAERRFFDTCFL